MVFNDALAMRQAARAAGEPYLSDAAVSAALTAAKATPDRAWLGEVSSVVLQQALADLNTAYRNFKARVKVARVHAHVTDARQDFHHKLSTALIRENQAVYVEDLAVKALARTRLAKSVHDAGWSAFVSMLEYKARLHGREFRRVGRFEPTSQVCSSCEVKDGPKPLSVREWQCKECGAVHDRDVNAARNILALGRRERRNARGGQVRPPLAVAQAVEAGSRRGAA